MMGNCQVRFLGGRDAATYALLPDNKALRYWIDNQNVKLSDLYKQCAILAKEFEWAGSLTQWRVKLPLNVPF